MPTKTKSFVSIQNLKYEPSEMITNDAYDIIYNNEESIDKTIDNDGNECRKVMYEALNNILYLLITSKNDPRTNIILLCRRFNLFNLNNVSQEKLAEMIGTKQQYISSMAKRLDEEMKSIINTPRKPKNRPTKAEYSARKLNAILSYSTASYSKFFEVE